MRVSNAQIGRMGAQHSYNKATLPPSSPHVGPGSLRPPEQKARRRGAEWRWRVPTPDARRSSRTMCAPHDGRQGRQGLQPSLLPGKWQPGRVVDADDSNPESWAWKPHRLSKSAPSYRRVCDDGNGFCLCCPTWWPLDTDGGSLSTWHVASMTEELKFIFYFIWLVATMLECSSRGRERD